ncbi:MAG: hypothetical protein H7836_08590 [Magnetococcus sp. YQC-3]
MQYPQGKNGSAVDVNGVQAPGSPGFSGLPTGTWMTVMIEPIPPPTLGETLACARKEVKESLETVEASIRHMALHGESCHETTRLRFLLISALEYIKASEKHMSTVVATLTGGHL